MKTDSISELLRVENLSRSFTTQVGEVKALQQVNLSIKVGELVALKGKSGSGKTTLLNLLGGLDQPSSGEIYFQGVAFNTLSEEDLVRLRRTQIGFVFQSFALMPTYSALENVELVLRLAGGNPKKGRQRAMQCLRAVGLGNRAHSHPNELSGGQQQRVAIARAVANHPDLILADEPTGELDTNTTRQIFSLFRRLVDQEGITVLLTSHNPLVEEVADRVIELEDGCIIDMK
ncbi:MAG: macrolide ABC transporter ATP-binding protein [Chloroflexi bacterium HGW-Chloroflexi-3]|nr:MAG: macrolide ABC transporter ATP-binding protein [Chloroflexi bacterium HGW-Chloroflexi-3]